MEARMSARSITHGWFFLFVVLRALSTKRSPVTKTTKTINNSIASAKIKNTQKQTSNKSTKCQSKTEWFVSSLSLQARDGMEE